MVSLYKITPELEEKYKKTLDLWQDTFFIRYYKRYFDLFTTGDYIEYLPLFSAFETAVEDRMREALEYKPETELTSDHFRRGNSVTVTRDLYHMYINFLENIILPELQEPSEGAKLWITTHNGGTHLAYYKEGKYEVPRGGKGVLTTEEAIVIHWLPYDEGYNSFTG